MSKFRGYESPDISMEIFACENGFDVSQIRFGDAYDDGFDDATMTSYEAFFYGNIDE